MEASENYQELKTKDNGKSSATLTKRVNTSLLIDKRAQRCKLEARQVNAQA